MSKLTFNIEDNEPMVGVKRDTPWRRLREKLFGIDTGRVSVRPVPINLAMQRVTAARTIHRPEPVSPQSSFAGAARVPAAPFVVEYKGRQIAAYPLADGSWTATHVPLGADLTAPRILNRHRFMARILAVASVEIEIDELEQS